MRPKNVAPPVFSLIAIRPHRGKLAVIVQLILIALWLASCGTSGSDQVPVSELPDPAIYALTLTELPKVGLSWQQTYNQTITDQGYKWSYLAYQAYQPGTLGGELESGFAINNDVYLYEINISRQELPQPPNTIGDLHNILWKSVSLTQRLGDKSALWKTAIGAMLTPAWRLEFYLEHAYVCISLFGFPDQIAPAIIYGLGDILAARLPLSAEALRSDAATQVVNQARPTSTEALQLTPSAGSVATQPQLIVTTTPDAYVPMSYTAPKGETGMATFFDDTGHQLTDGITGVDDIMADLGSGTAYEWVGWAVSTDPVTLTFTFSAQVNISAVEIGFNHREGLGIFVPNQVEIGDKSFDLEADAVPNNQRKDLVFTGVFSGSNLQVVLHHRGRGWILVDEIRFIPGN